MASKFLRILRFLGIWLAISLVWGLLAAFDMGMWPKALKGWILLVLLAFPIYLFSEYLGDKLFSEKISGKLEKQDKVISFKRMAYTFAVLLLATALSILLFHLAKKYLGNYFSFE